MQQNKASVKPYQPSFIVAIVAVALGVFFRFYHVDDKVYSGDEVYTAVRMLGESESDIIRTAGRAHDAHDLWLVLHPDPQHDATNIFATVRGLAREEPQHPPAYFVMGHLWLRAFGTSIWAVRSLSVLISLLALPLAFWLGVELYGTQRAGWISVALFALSPVGVLYAQEAREYSLWTVALLALSSALLRAIRLDRGKDWWLVAGLGAAALYVYPLSGFVMVGLAVYVFVTCRSNRRLLLRCSAAFAAAGLAFVPWLVILFQHTTAVKRGIATVLGDRLSPLEIARAFAGLLRLNIVDFNLVQSSRLGVVLTAAALALLLCAFGWMLRRQPPRVSLFVVFPILATALPMLVADLFGGQSVRLPRYFMPVYLYIDVCFVGLIAAGIAGRAGAAWRGYAFFACLLVARTASCAVSSQATTWWNKMEDNSIPVATVVNATPRGLVVSDNTVVYPLVLANYLRPDTPLVLRPRCYLCTEPPATDIRAADLPPIHPTDVFALGPSPQLQSLLQSLIARRQLRVTYHCINTRHNCVSDLNVEPVFAGGVPAFSRMSHDGPGSAR